MLGRDFLEVTVSAKRAIQNIGVTCMIKRGARESAGPASAVASPFREKEVTRFSPTNRAEDSVGLAAQARIEAKVCIIEDEEAKEPDIEKN